MPSLISNTGFPRSAPSCDLHRCNDLHCCKDLHRCRSHLVHLSPATSSLSTAPRDPLTPIIIIKSQLRVTRSSLAQASVGHRRLGSQGQRLAAATTPHVPTLSSLPSRRRTLLIPLMACHAQCLHSVSAIASKSWKE